MICVDSYAAPNDSEETVTSLLIYAMKMAEFYTFEILVTNYKNIKCHKQEDYNFSIYCQGYLNSQQFALHAARCRILINVTN